MSQSLLDNLNIYKELWQHYCLALNKDHIVFLETYMKEIMSNIKSLDKKVWANFSNTLPGYASFTKRRDE